jgi:hypothetical protein
MKRKLLLFALILVVMLAVKYALGQNPSGSDPVSVFDFGSGSELDWDIGIPMLLAPIAGLACALLRMLVQRLSGPQLQPLRISLPPK